MGKRYSTIPSTEGAVCHCGVRDSDETLEAVTQIRIEQTSVCHQ